MAIEREWRIAAYFRFRHGLLQMAAPFLRVVIALSAMTPSGGENQLMMLHDDAAA